MRFLGVLASLCLIAVVLVDGFEVILQPRRVTRPYRYAAFYYRRTWPLWRALARRMRPGWRREALLSLFGPLSLLGLFISWVGGLVVGFGLLHWSLGTPLQSAGGHADVLTYLYLSGTTLFTLGYGDITPTASLGRVLAVIESGLGFGFLAVIISYLPVLYSAYSSREVTISRLDARASSPPTASEMLVRAARGGDVGALEPLLVEFERWSSELLESHLSFPVLGFYRSQHDNQSWLAALTAMLDACALLIAGVPTKSCYQAQLTFAMARHAAVDLSLVLKALPRTFEVDRVPVGALGRLREQLRQAGIEIDEGPAVGARLGELRAMYEPFVNALSEFFLMPLPPVVAEGAVVDNWQKSAWMRRAPGFGDLRGAPPHNDHF